MTQTTIQKKHSKWDSRKIMYNANLLMLAALKLCFLGFMVTCFTFGFVVIMLSIF